MGVGGELVFHHRQFKRFSYPEFVHNKLTFIEHLLCARYCSLYTQYFTKSSQQAKSYLDSHFPDKKTKAQTTTWYDLPKYLSK